MKALPQCAQEVGGILGPRQTQETPSLSQQRCVLRSFNPSSMHTDVPRPGGHCADSDPPENKGAGQDAHPHLINTLSAPALIDTLRTVRRVGGREMFDLTAPDILRPLSPTLPRVSGPSPRPL